VAQWVYTGIDLRVILESAVVVFKPPFQSLAAVDSHCVGRRVITTQSPLGSRQGHIVIGKVDFLQLNMSKRFRTEKNSTQCC
jgi:hypothetical protein